MNLSETIVLENEAVRLEPLTMEHLEALLPIAEAHPDLLRFSPSPFGSEEGLRQNIQDALDARNRGERYAFAILDKATNTFVGSTSYGGISPKNQRLEIGWTWIDRNVQGTGLNKQCKHVLLSHAFDNLKMERVEFKTDSRNKQSRRAIEKVGGIFEGTLRSHTLMLDGYRRDTVYYSILREEWSAVETRVFGQSS